MAGDGRLYALSHDATKLPPLNGECSCTAAHGEVGPLIASLFKSARSGTRLLLIQIIFFKVF